MLDTTMSVRGRDTPHVHRATCSCIARAARPGLHPRALSRRLGRGKSGQDPRCNRCRLLLPRPARRVLFAAWPSRNTSNACKPSLHARDRSAGRICPSNFAVRWTGCHVTTSSSSGGRPRASASPEHRKSRPARAASLPKASHMTSTSHLTFCPAPSLMDLVEGTVIASEGCRRM